MFVRGVHTVGHHYDRKTGFQQLFGNTFTEDDQLVAQEKPRGRNKGPIQALHQLGAELSDAGSRKACTVRRVPGNE